MFDKEVLNLPGIRKMMVLLVGNSFLQAIFIIVQGLTLSSIITNLWDGKSLSSVLGMLVVFGSAFLLRYICDALRDKSLITYSRTQAENLRESLLGKVFKMGPVLIQQQGTGNVVTMALEGIDQVEKYLRLVLSKAVDMMIIPFMILIIVFLLNWVSGIILLCAFPLIILFMIILGQAAKSKADQQYATFQQLSNHFTDSIRGLRTLKHLGIDQEYEKSIFNTSERFRKATMNTLVVALTSSFALDFFTTLSIAILAVYLGFKLINGGITLFPALAILILSPDYFLPIQNFGNDYHATLNGKNSFKAINQILKINMIEDKPQKITEWNQDSSLEINNLQVNYKDEIALKKLNFKVSGMKKVGIVGLSGSGKSTLINTLSGFIHPKNGLIKINDCELTSFAQTDWQNQITYIPQNPYIFQLSLKDNIKFYTPDATDQQVQEAIHVVGLDDLVTQLPDGVNTMIGEGARALSGGQAQRIALARAFLDKKRHIMLFDEPTAHLDIEIELELKNRMMPIMANRLVFFATHRLHWLQQMDYILVLRDGKIIEQGTLTELKKKHGELSNLLREVQQS
nr:thiol reductant ABC exporter subunit CydD [uncultured Ligilactobacillus sp.]